MAEAAVVIQVNKMQLDDCYSLLSYIKNGTETVLIRAINKTLAGARTDGVQILYDHYNLTKTRIRSSFEIPQKAARGRLSVKVLTKGKSVPLIDFEARQTTKGASFKILRTGLRQTVPYMFVAAGKKTGEKFVGARKGAMRMGRPLRKIPYAKLPEKYRYPVRKRYGPRIQDYLGDPGPYSAWQEKVGARLDGHMKHEAEYLIAKKLQPGDGYDTMA
jgi:hypothetical protein